MRNASLASIPVFPLAELKDAPLEFASFVIESLDNAIDAMPRGAITEISAPLLGARQCITCNSFDLISASAAGMEFSRLVWVGCDRNLRKASKAADIRLHAGGFGTVCLDIAGAQPYV